MLKVAVLSIADSLLQQVFVHREEARSLSQDSFALDPKLYVFIDWRAQDFCTYEVKALETLLATRGRLTNGWSVEDHQASTRQIDLTGVTDFQHDHLQIRARAILSM